MRHATDSRQARAPLVFVLAALDLVTVAWAVAMAVRVLA